MTHMTNICAATGLCQNEAAATESMMDLMVKTNIHGKSFNEWQHDFPSEFGSLVGDGPEIALRLLENVLQRFKDDKLGKALEKAGQPKLAKVVMAFINFKNSALPEVWEVVLKECTESLLCNQTFFKDVCGGRAQFLPEPESLEDAKNFWHSCATHVSPSHQMETLLAVAGSLGKEDEIIPVKDRFSLCELMKKTAQVMTENWMHFRMGCLPGKDRWLIDDEIIE